MSLKEQLLSDMKVAMKEKQTLRKNTIQMVRGAVLQKEKDTLTELSDEQILEIILQELKKRKDAMCDFEKGGRLDLVKEAQGEMDVLSHYLPKQLAEDEIKTVVQEIITETGAQSMKDMGKVMAAASSRMKGQADTGLISKIVKEQLS